MNDERRTPDAEDSPTRARPPAPPPMTPEHPLAVRFAEPVHGPSYRPAARMLAGALLAAIALYGARVIAAGGFGAAGWAVLAAGALGLAATGWPLFAGRTTVDARGIHQTGWPGRSLRWQEIARARTVRLPPTSRLLVSGGTGPLKAFHAGCRELDDAFAQIGAWYARAPRRGD